MHNWRETVSAIKKKFIMKDFMVKELTKQPANHLLYLWSEATTVADIHADVVILKKYSLVHYKQSSWIGKKEKKNREGKCVELLKCLWVKENLYVIKQ